MNNRKQLTVLFFMLIVYAFSAFAVYAFFTDELAAMAGVPMSDMGVSNAVLGLANAGIVLVVYGIIGMVGYWFARKLELPGIFNADGNWRRWFTIPLVLGLMCGVIIISLDIVFAPINGYGRIEHPSFPSSIFASIGAGIGEEILFRGFFFGLWGLLLNWVFKRFNRRTLLLWIANVIAALAFAASHMGTLLLLTGASSPAELSPVLLIEVFLLNGLIGLVAGERYMKDGLVAATGIHFWADIVFHVIWGVL